MSSSVGRRVIQWGGHHGTLPSPNSALGFHCIKVLDWLHQAQAERPSVIPNVRDFLAAGDLPPDLDGHQAPQWLPEVVATLDDAGLIRVHKGMSELLGYGLQLTDAGMRDIAERVDRRRDRTARRAAARRGVLRWLDEVSEDVRTHPELQTILSNPWGTYEGAFFEINELVAACDYLIEKALVSSTPLGLTAAGRECVDIYGGQVSEYLGGRQPRTQNFTNNFYDKVGSLQLAQGNKDVQQNQSVQGVNADDFALLAQALREAAPALGLSDSRRTELEHVATQMAEAANGDEVEPERAGRLVSWGRDVLTDASSSALAQLLQAVMGGLSG